MIELEQVEKLREKANVTFAEAKEALENAGGDMLDALIALEKQGKVTAPAGGGFFSSGGNTEPNGEETPVQGGGCKKRAKQNGESFWEMIKRFGRFCLKLIDKGNKNFLDATKGGEPIFACPVTVVVILMICFFWVTVPLFIISLFLGFRYRFRGDELGRDAVNKVMDSAADAVEDVKKTFAEDNGK